MSSENYKIVNQHSIYFLTLTITDWVDVFIRPEYNHFITSGLTYCREHKGLKLYAWCLMSNHLHLVCQTEEPFRMSDFLRDYKQFTAKRILDAIINGPESRKDWMLYRFEFAGKFDNRIKQYRFWQDINHPVELHSTALIEQKINYIHENPVRRMIVERAEDYLFSSARNYAGLSAQMEIDMI